MSSNNHKEYDNTQTTQQRLNKLSLNTNTQSAEQQPYDENTENNVLRTGTPQRAQQSYSGAHTPPTTGHVDLSALAATPTSLPSSGAANRDTNLPVIDPDGALEQCCDWSFIVELLGDVMNDREQIVTDMQDAIDTNDHVKYYKTAHALKGAALNLHLPALVDVSKAAELLGKELEKKPDDSHMLAERQGYVDALNVEYDRLNEYLPEAQANADAEAGGLEDEQYED